MGWHWWETLGLAGSTHWPKMWDLNKHLGWSTSGHTGIGRAPEKAQESLKSPTSRKASSYAFGASSNPTWIKLFRRVGLFSWRICKDLVILWNPMASLQLPGPLFTQRLLSLLEYHVLLNISKDSSERDILRVNSWINKTFQNEHCCWSLNMEIFWLYHLMTHTGQWILRYLQHSLLLLANGHCNH